MPSTREIRRRIKSVKNIAQVTKAMEAVSAAKMRKAQQQVTATRPYAKQAREVLTYIARLTTTDHELNPLDPAAAGQARRHPVGDRRSRPGRWFQCQRHPPNCAFHA